MKIFISYATEDLDPFQIPEIVNLLEIQKDEIEKVYYWQRDTELGQSFDEYMTQNIKRSDVMLLFCSNISQKSSAVFQEIGMAKMANIRIVPIFQKNEYIIEGFQNYRGVQFLPNRFRESFRELFSILTGKEPILLEKHIFSDNPFDIQFNLEKTIQSFMTNRQKELDKLVDAPLIPSRHGLFNSIEKNLIENKINRLFCISGDKGAGKSHILSNIARSPQLMSNNLCFVNIKLSDLNLDQNLMNLGVYKKLFLYYGDLVLEKFKTLIDGWSVGERRFGFFRLSSLAKVQENAQTSPIYKSCLNIDEPELSKINIDEYRRALNNVIEVLISMRANPEIMPLVEEWLSGEIMEMEQLMLLNTQDTLKNKLFISVIWKMINFLLADHVIYCFDDFHDILAELTNQHKEKFIMILKDILAYNEVILSTVSNQFENVDKFFKESAGVPINYSLEKIDKQDTYSIYQSKMAEYFETNNIGYIPEEEFYPLGKKTVGDCYTKSNKLPAGTIKCLKRKFDEFLANL
ncbi:MAG: TIR domain-containing protein [Candidatus Lokiarchaeota archaeon]|nr:TIR domain-containing protein [Candidatus Lokiarchaeota archaeon]